MNNAPQASEPPQAEAATEDSVIPFSVRSLTNSLFAAFQAKVKGAAACADEPVVDLVPCRD